VDAQFKSGFKEAFSEGLLREYGCSRSRAQTQRNPTEIRERWVGEIDE